MRRFIDFVVTPPKKGNLLLEFEQTNEGDVVPFPGNSRATNNLAVVQGGANVVGFPREVPLNAFAHGYVVAALWSTLDGSDQYGGNPLDHKYSAKDIATPTLEQMAADCAKFQHMNASLLAAAYGMSNYTEDDAGHDFWLTRNHHGSGFPDRGLGKVGEKLTDVAHRFGETDLYVGDDGMLHA